MSLQRIVGKLFKFIRSKFKCNRKSPEIVRKSTGSRKQISTQSTKSEYPDRQSNLKRVHFSDKEPLVTVCPSVDSLEIHEQTLHDIYAELVPADHNIKIQVEPRELQSHAKTLQVFMPRDDFASCVATVIDTQLEVTEDHSETDLVIALFSYKARSGKELSFRKGDSMMIRKRTQYWFYGTKVKDDTKKGWIPASYVTKLSAA